MTQRRPRQAQARRRMRLLVVASVLFAGAVLLTGLPVSALLTQRHQLSTAAAQLQGLQAADRSLSDRSHQLTNTSTVQGLARSDYGLVPPGQKAYVILPPPGASSAIVAGSGHVPLNGPPVVPGSPLSQELLGLPATTQGSSGSTAGASATSSKAASGRTGNSSSASVTSSSRPGSFWSRVVHSLEFWR